VAAQELEHPRGIAVAWLGQNGEDICPLEANVAQEVVVQITERDNMPAVPGRSEEVEDG
jgi:hypothetical protein